MKKYIIKKSWGNMDHDSRNIFAANLTQINAQRLNSIKKTSNITKDYIDPTDRKGRGPCLPC